MYEERAACGCAPSAQPAPARPPVGPPAVGRRARCRAVSSAGWLAYCCCKEKLLGEVWFLVCRRYADAFVLTQSAEPQHKLNPRGPSCSF